MRTSFLLALGLVLAAPLGAGSALAASGPAPGAPAVTTPAAHGSYAPPPRIAAYHDQRAPLEWQFGKGKPTTTIVFMHGLGGEPEGHDKLLGPLLTPEHGGGGALGAALARGETVRVIAPYMRPESGKGMHTMTDQLQRARAVIDAQEGPVILMGHSFGGKAAIKLAQEYGPEKVTGVIALAPSVNMLYSYWKQVTGERGLPKDPRVIDARLAQVEESLASRIAATPPPSDDNEWFALKNLQGELQYARQMRDLARHDEASMEGAGALQRPMLLFHGTADRAVSIHYAQRFAEGNAPNVKMVTLPEVGHGFYTRPEVTKAMASEIAAFIKTNRRAPEAR